MQITKRKIAAFILHHTFFDCVQISAAHGYRALIINFAAELNQGERIGVRVQMKENCFGAAVGVLAEPRQFNLQSVGIERIENLRLSRCTQLFTKRFIALEIDGNFHLCFFFQNPGIGQTVIKPSDGIFCVIVL